MESIISIRNGLSSILEQGLRVNIGGHIGTALGQRTEGMTNYHFDGDDLIE